MYELSNGRQRPTPRKPIVRGPGEGRVIPGPEGLTVKASGQETGDAIGLYSMMTFGLRFADRDGASEQRARQTLIYFGVVMLALAALVYGHGIDGRFDLQGPLTLSLLDRALQLGITFLGLPYLAWIILRRPDRLSVDSSEVLLVERSTSRGLPGGLSLTDVGIFLLMATVVALCLAGIPMSMPTGRIL